MACSGSRASRRTVGCATQNKLWQLQCAQQLGLKLPPTLVSQDPQASRAFAAAHASLIVKAVKGSRQLSLDTVSFDPAQTDDASMQLSPAIYQARVGGQRHLRINAFGQQTIAIAIDAQELDWRRNLNVPLYAVQLPPALASALQALRRRLGLEMAVFDGKIDEDGDFVFFEANPQGQFLFAQPLAGVDLAERFASFLLAGPADPTCEPSLMRV